MSHVPPVRKQVIVEASQEHAFRVFTDGIDRWWPRQHHIGSSPLLREVLEPRLGGRWYAVSQDGSECDVGRVLVWEPPRRLVVTWQINGQWQYDPTFVTEIEVTFTPEGARRTRVELEHRLLERYGDAAPALREQLDKPSGWGITMEAFAQLARTEA
jgi:uncharacterized protein YndB with AHSA1/START domain